MISEKTLKTGSNRLIEELDKYFEIYADELKENREGRQENVVFLKDSEMFDIVIKLLDKKEKIEKLATKTDDKPAEETKIRNIQGFALSAKK